MPIFLRLLGGLLIEIACHAVGKVLLSLGIGFLTFKGLNTSIDYLVDMSVNRINSIPAEYVSMFAYLKIGNVISIITSAYVARLILNGLTSDTIRRMVFK